MPNLLLLMPPGAARQAVERAREAGAFGEIFAVDDVRALIEAAAKRRWDVLLSFGSGVIVPAGLLDSPGLLALNVHAASPAYPGRDPHHFAAYDGVREYGATLHLMTAKVDQGPIVEVDLVESPPDATPQQLLELANAAGLRLLRRALELLARGQRPVARAGLAWSGPVRRRRDFVMLCRVDPAMPEHEFQRRRHAAAMPGYANLWTEVHGCRFVLEAPR